MNIFDLLIVQPIFNLLVAIYAIVPGGDFGISLILFTVLVRLLMWPLVKKQLHQVKAMRKLQPELVKIKAKAKGNKQLETMQMLELYKKHGVNPFRSIGILLIQLPIFFGLYRVIQILTLEREQVEKYTYSFLENLAPIKQIIENPQSFNETFLGVDLTKLPITAEGVSVVLVIFAVAAAVMQYFISKQTMPHDENAKGLRQIMAEAAEGKQADQSEMNAAVMNKMIKFIPFLMLFVMMSLPGAISLYYLVSNVVAYFQQDKILKQDEHELEEIAEEQKKPSKKATAKARAKLANEATVTKIVAKENTRKK